MRLWINIFDDDNGITSEVHTSAANSEESAVEYVSVLWADYGKGVRPPDWRDAQRICNDNGCRDSVHVDIHEVVA
ncbi:MAG: hypothetical protein Unbinned5081contig1001_19 [Prokaryotic dsDNA virus sp.]|nr:MAG: hypothetical protein Unbinned5081contig1001_19 [Prokaryotic dsDNA virus sp.]|tara:strand:+ start:1764 stop:1988 length:225 start_codon:yes stop_codon:yes gene_type:complete